MHIKCGMGSINRHAPSRTVPKTWKTVHSDLTFKMVKITELKVCALQTRPYRLYVRHRLLTTEWTRSISCRWERPISYLIRRMLIDISLSLDISITASAVGHQAEADGPVRPGEERGPAPHWAVDGGQPLQRHSGGVEPRVTGHYQPVPHSSYTHTRSRFIFDSSKLFFWSSVMLISPFGLLCVQTMVKTFELCDLPVRVAKFVARKHWVIAGAVSVWTQWERPCAY